MKDDKIIQLFPNSPKVEVIYEIETEEDAVLKLFHTLRTSGVIHADKSSEDEIDFVLFINAVEVCQYRQIALDIFEMENNREPTHVNEEFLQRMVEDLIFDKMSPPETTAATLIEPWRQFMIDVREVLQRE